MDLRIFTPLYRGGWICPMGYPTRRLAAPNLVLGDTAGLATLLPRTEHGRERHGPEGGPERPTLSSPQEFPALSRFPGATCLPSLSGNMSTLEIDREEGDIV
jgi:hypothetical protein